MAYTYDPIFAADPSNAANVAANASIILFNPADSGKAPITITDVTGAALPNPITVNKNGFGPAFQHATLDRVGWFGAGFTGYFTSYEGMKAVAVEAAADAQAAAGTAGTEAAAVATAAIGTATDASTAAAASAATAASNALASATAAANSAALVGAPADAAITAAINNGASATRGALNATYAPVARPATIGASAPLTRPYDAARQAYNVAPRHLRRTMAKIAAARAGTGLLKWLMVGDSNTEGDGTDKVSTSFPARTNALFVGSGLKDGGTGLTFLAADTRWTRTGWTQAEWSKRHTYVSAGTTATTFTSNKAGTIVDYYYDATTPAHTISVDGATPVAVPTGAEKVAKYSITGLNDSLHTVVITPSAAGVRIYGVDVRRSSGVALTNAGISGSRSVDWDTTLTEGDAPYKVTSAWTPDLVTIMLGTNDAGTGVGAVQFKDTLQRIAAGYKATADVVLCTMIPRNVVMDRSAWFEAIYAVAEALDLPVIDASDRWGTYTAMSSFYFDNTHMNATGTADLGFAVLSALGLPYGTQAPEVPAPMQPVGVLIASDTFNRADGAPGSTPSGAFAWTAYNATPTITGNRLSVVPTADVDGIAAREYITTTFSDGVLKAKITPAAPGGWGVGIAFRQNLATYSGWTVEAYGGTTYLLRKHTAANTYVTVVTSAVTVTAGDLLEVNMNGSNIVVKVNGTQIASVTDAHNSTAVQHGFVARGSGRYFDDFEFRQLA